MDARVAAGGEWTLGEQWEGSGRYGSSGRGVDAREAVGGQWMPGKPWEGSAEWSLTAVARMRPCLSMARDVTAAVCGLNACTSSS